MLECRGRLCMTSRGCTKLFGLARKSHSFRPSCTGAASRAHSVSRLHTKLKRAGDSTLPPFTLGESIVGLNSTPARRVRQDPSGPRGTRLTPGSSERYSSPLPRFCDTVANFQATVPPGAARPRNAPPRQPLLVSFSRSASDEVERLAKLSNYV